MINRISRHPIALVSCLLVFSSGTCQSAETTADAPRAVALGQTIGEIEILSPAAENLVDPDAQIELLATGFDWSEGPVWIVQSDNSGFVVFSDVPQNVVYKWQEGEGLSEFLRPSGYTQKESRGGESGSNGLALDAAGRLILCQHGDIRVARMDAPVHMALPNFVTIAGDYQGKKFNSPNDLAIHSSGAIYFTDPPYGRMKRWEDEGRELDFTGVYRVSPEGEVTLLTKEFRAPNGIAFSPDEKTLYVAQSDPENAIWKAFDVRDDGTIENGRVLLDVTELLKTRPGNPDGLKVDKQGVLFATGPGGVLMISPEGEHLGTIRTGEKIANCAFGERLDDGGQMLYMTSDMHLCRVRLKTQAK